MDLAGELRNQVYSYLKLAKREPIELLPKASQCTRNAPYNVHKYHDLRNTRTRKSISSLMRLNKTIHAEVGSIFYGVNEFRFTGAYGWMVLRGFMDTIGPLNTSFLRNITIHVPWLGRSTDRSDQYDNIKEFQQNIEKYHWGAAALVKTFRNTPTSFRECMEKFHEAGNLAKLNLVLPFNYEVKCVVDLNLDLSKFQKPPEVTLIHLRRNQLPQGFLDSVDESQLPLKKLKPGYKIDRKGRKKTSEVEQWWKNPKIYAKKQGWRFEMMRYGETGVYPEDPVYSNDPGDELDSDEDE